jgi:hypothetical protein
MSALVWIAIVAAVVLVVAWIGWGPDLPKWLRGGGDGGSWWGGDGGGNGGGSA